MKIGFIIIGRGGRMGMYSTFEDEEIEVTDAKGLTEFLIKTQSDTSNCEYMYESFLKDLIDGKPYSFEDWDSLKLISYWYSNQVIFLKELGKYINGWVRFSFETGDQDAIIRFTNGETIIELGNMKYDKYTADDLLGLVERK